MNLLEQECNLQQQQQQQQPRIININERRKLCEVLFMYLRVLCVEQIIPIAQI